MYLYGQKEFFTNSFVSYDNETQFNLRSYQGYQTQLDSLLKKDSIFIKRKSFVGISNGIRYYTTLPNQPTFFFNEAKISIKSNPLEGFNIQFNPSILISKNFSLFSYEFNTNYRYKKWYLEISSERDLVGARALEVNLISNYHGISVDYTPFKNLTIVGGYQYNSITDNNKRDFYFSRIIYTLPNEKIYFDFRTRDMRNGTWSEYYFSPEKIAQRQLGLGYNNLVLSGKGVFKGYLGVGIQEIDQQSMYLLVMDLKFKMNINKKIQSETTLGFRNFNKYIYSFGEVKLRYNF